MSAQTPMIPPNGLELHEIATWSRYSKYDAAYRVVDPTDNRDLGIIKEKIEWYIPKGSDDVTAKDLRSRYYISSDDYPYPDKISAARMLYDHKMKGVT